MTKKVNRVKIISNFDKRANKIRFRMTIPQKIAWDSNFVQGAKFYYTIERLDCPWLVLSIIENDSPGYKVTLSSCGPRCARFQVSLNKTILDLLGWTGGNYLLGEIISENKIRFRKDECQDARNTIERSTRSTKIERSTKSNKKNQF